jgi:hypothetical protein
MCPPITVSALSSLHWRHKRTCFASTVQPRHGDSRLSVAQRNPSATRTLRAAGPTGIEPWHFDCSFLQGRCSNHGVR